MNTLPLRCALLSSFTLDPLPPLVTADLSKNGGACQWYVGAFNQYPQLILRENSELYAFAPQVVFLAAAIEDLLDNLPSPWSEPEQRVAEAERRIADFLALVRGLAERLPAATIFVHDFLPLEPQPLSVLATNSPSSLRGLSVHANNLLMKMARECRKIFVLHLDEVLAGQSLARAFDPRFFYVAKMRLGRAAMERLAEYYRRLLIAYLGLRKKCIVLDLDNTLWGGIVGEDGPENLVLGDDGLGRAFQDMQRILLHYHETGTLLAICSKNDEELALSVIRSHPGMKLRPNHFAAMRINWQDKASNLRAIANELNLGLDALVFLDDSEFERTEVRRRVPEVTVADLPADPSDYPAFVAQLPYFDALTATEEDQRRGQMYVEDRQRRELEKHAISLEEFLRGLDIRVSVRHADRMLLPRLAQLTQRTNQFNLTTRRYTESDLCAMICRGDWRLYSAQARDRIGDSGIIGAALIQLDKATATARLDTFLLSCRILGRGIESAFLASVLLDLEAAGFESVLAEFLPTKRNAIAKDFLPSNGFVLEREFWRRQLTDADTLCPTWIKLEIAPEQ